MQKKTLRAKTDPLLKLQLNDQTSDQELIEAVFTLRAAKEKNLSPSSVEEMTYKVLDRVADQVGVEAKEINIFRNLGAFAVSAPPNFIRALLTEPEIASATANRREESMMIPPQKKRRVS